MFIFFPIWKFCGRFRISINSDSVIGHQGDTYQHLVKGSEGWWRVRTTLHSDIVLKLNSLHCQSEGWRVLGKILLPRNNNSIRLIKPPWRSAGGKRSVVDFPFSGSRAILQSGLHFNQELFLREFAAYCFAAYCRLIYVCAFFQVWEVYIRLASERGDFVAANGVNVDNAVCAVGNGFYWRHLRVVAHHKCYGGHHCPAFRRQFHLVGSFILFLQRKPQIFRKLSS